MTQTSEQFLIGTEDLNLWDGGSRSYTRRTSTGGTLNLNKIGPEVDVAMVYGSGVPSGAAISAAIGRIGSTAKATLLLQPGTWNVNTNLTIPTNLTLKLVRGALMTIDTGVTVTINGTLEAGLYQIFSCTGTGKVVFGSGAVKEMHPEWWAANTSPGITDMINAINAAEVAQIGGRIALSSSAYGISTPITHYCDLVGNGMKSTSIVALAGFSGTMMVDFNATTYFVSKQTISGVKFDASVIAGLNIFGSSAADPSLGQSIPYVEAVHFYGAGGYAVYAPDATISGPGAFTGGTFIHCQFDACDGQLNLGVNQDDVRIINGRFNLTSNSAQYPFRFAGQNLNWDGGFVYFGNLHNSSGVKSIFRTLSNVSRFNGIFLETNNSDITHIWDFPGVVAMADISNINLRVNDLTQTPNLVALARVVVSGWTNARYPSLTFSNIYNYNLPTTSYKLADVFVGASANTDYLTLDFRNVDAIAPPLFAWITSGATTVARSTVFLRGMHRGLNYNAGYRQSITNTVPYEILAPDNKDGLVSSNGVVTTSAAVSPQTGTFTLPSTGIWLVTVTAKNLNASPSHMATGLWLMNYSLATNNLLTAEQLGTTQKNGSASTLTLSVPDTGGVITATAAWTGGGSYITEFDFKARKVSNNLTYGN